MSDYSVVVPSASGTSSLGRTVDSILRAIDAVPGIEVDIVVVDDRQETLNSSLELRGNTAAVRMLRAGGVGSGLARNLGAASTVAPWLIFIDDDVILDDDALAGLHTAISRGRSDVLLGSTRAPEGAPSWLHDAYERGVLGFSPEGSPQDGAVRGLDLISHLFAIRRTTFEKAGGYPGIHEWGVTDVLLGFRLETVRASFERSVEFSGVHDYLPSWLDWIERRKRAGEQIARLVGRCESTEQRSDLLRKVHLDWRVRSIPKHLAGFLPILVARFARGRSIRRLAAAGAEAKGYRSARRPS